MGRGGGGHGPALAKAARWLSVRQAEEAQRGSRVGEAEHIVAEEAQPKRKAWPCISPPGVVKREKVSSDGERTKRGESGAKSEQRERGRGAS